MTTNDWVKKKLVDICTVEIGGTPARNTSAYWDTNGDSSNLWVSIKDLNQRIIYDTAEKITDAGVRHSNAKLVKAGSILMSFKLTIGKVAFAGSALYTNEAIAALNSEEVDLNFLYYGLQQWDLLADVDQAIKGATLNKQKIRNIEACLPASKEEQAKIAEVLTAVDHTIAQTEALIAKYQRIKTGLMQDLLTRGIDEDGRLRNPATHEFKDSPLGLIPQKWEVITLGEVVANSRGTIQTGPFGSQLHAHEYTHEGIPVIMPQDMMEDGRIDFQQIARIPANRANALKRHIVKANDVVFARRGDLSRCVPIYQDDIGLCGTGCILVRVPAETLSANWLAFIYRHHHCQRQIAARAVGSTMVNLNTQLLSDLIITRPNIEEQRQISGIIENVNALIDAKTTHLNKLNKVKIGLMQDLLTGKVSVAPLLDGQQE